MNPWSQVLGSPASYHIKKYLFDVLKERYHSNEAFIDRLSSIIHTSEDIEGLGKLVSDLYELGYLKSVEDHKEMLSKRGLKATIKPEVSVEMEDKHRIFPKPN